MKSIKTIIAFITLSVISIPSAFAFSISPSTQTVDQANNSVSTYDCADVNPPDQTWVSYYADGSFNTTFSNSNCVTDFSGLSFAAAITGTPPPVTAGTYHFLELDCNPGCSSSDDYSNQLPNAIGSFDLVVIDNPPDSPPVTGMIQNASSTMAAALGITPNDVGGFMWSQLAAPVMGAGLGFLQTIFPYILALIIISAIVRFTWRAFRGGGWGQEWGDMQADKERENDRRLNYERDRDGTT